MTTGFKEKEFNDGFNLNVWKRIFQYLKPCKKYIYFLCGLTLIASIAESAFTLLNRYAINHFIGQSFNHIHFIGYIVISVIFAIVQSQCFYYIFINCAHIESKYGAHLREDVYQKLMNLSFKYFDSNPLGWILARVTSDITRIAEVLAWSIFDFSWGLLTVLIGAIVMLVIDYRYACIILVLMPLLVYSTYWFQIRILKLYRIIRMRNSRITGSFNEGINGAKTTKTLVLEDTNLQEFKDETRLMNQYSMKAGRLQSVYRPFINLFSGTAMAFILWFGGKQVFQESLEIGTLFLFCQYAVQFFDPLRQIAQLLSEAQMAQANAERIVSLLDEVPSIQDSEAVIEKYG
ncbi:MAG: ABC transporter transmembrane domain-containing protein, partial [Erysipelotrichaceae bacterium]